MAKTNHKLEVFRLKTYLQGGGVLAAGGGGSPPGTNKKTSEFQTSKKTHFPSPRWHKLDPSVTKGCQKRPQNRSKTDFFSALWGAGRTCTKHHYLLCITHIGGSPEWSLFRPFAIQGPGKKESAQKDVKMAARVDENGDMCPKWSPKWMPKSTQNRSKIEVLGQCLPPEFQNVDFGGPGLLFGSLGVPPEVQNRRKTVQMGWHMDAIGIGKKC